MLKDPGLLTAICIIAGALFILIVYNKTKSKNVLHRSIFGIFAVYLCLLFCFTPIVQENSTFSFTSTDFTFSRSGVSKGTYLLNGNTLILTFSDVNPLHEANGGITADSKSELIFNANNNTIRNISGDEWRKKSDSNNIVERDLNGTAWEQDSFGSYERLTATGLHIATGTGIFSSYNAYTYVFILLICNVTTSVCFSLLQFMSCISDPHYIFCQPRRSEINLNFETCKPAERLRGVERLSDLPVNLFCFSRI